MAQKERITSWRTRILSIDSGGGCLVDAAIAFVAVVGGICESSLMIAESVTDKIADAPCDESGQASHHHQIDMHLKVYRLSTELGLICILAYGTCMARYRPQTFDIDVWHYYVPLIDVARSRISRNLQML